MGSAVFLLMPFALGGMFTTLSEHAALWLGKLKPICVESLKASGGQQEIFLSGSSASKARLGQKTAPVWKGELCWGQGL